jgi:aromatic-amino-acid transaminase
MVSSPTDTSTLVSLPALHSVTLSNQLLFCARHVVTTALARFLQLRHKSNVSMNHLISSRQNRPVGDVIFSLNAEATGRARSGEAVVNATIGTLLNDNGSLAILDTVSEVVRAVSPADWAAYAPIAGTDEFNRAVISDLFFGHDRFAACATAVATPGGTGALRHALMNFLEPGQRLLTPNLYWGPYQTLCDEHERRIDTFTMFDARGTLDLAALETKLIDHLTTQGRALLFLNDPCNNPTGYSMSRDEWRGVTQTLLKHSAGGSITLLVDMAYALYGAANWRDFLHELSPLLGKTGLLFAWSASKSFTHYGLRIGALVACEPEQALRTQIQAALAYACRGTWSNCTRGGLTAITRLLTEPALKNQVDREREQLRLSLQRRVSTFNRLASAKGLRYPRYEGGFFVMVFVEQAKAKAEAMKKKGVFVVPQEGALRVALCSVADTQIPALVDALASD